MSCTEGAAEVLRRRRGSPDDFNDEDLMSEEEDMDVAGPETERIGTVEDTAVTTVQQFIEHFTAPATQNNTDNTVYHYPKRIDFAHSGAEDMASNPVEFYRQIYMILTVSLEFILVWWKRV